MARFYFGGGDVNFEVVGVRGDKGIVYFNVESFLSESAKPFVLFVEPVKSDLSERNFDLRILSIEFPTVLQLPDINIGQL